MQFPMFLLLSKFCSQWYHVNVAGIGVTQNSTGETLHELNSEKISA